MPRPKILAAIAASGVAAVGGGVLASSPGIDGGAEAGVAADRVVADIGDLVVVFDSGEVDDAVVEATETAAAASGGYAATRRGGSLGLQRVTRQAVTVHSAPDGYLIPVVFVAGSVDAVRGAHGIDVSAVTAAGDVVVNELTATQTGAVVGDRLDLRAANGSVVSLQVGLIATDEVMGGTELVFDLSVAEDLGFDEDTSAVLWGFDRVLLEAALDDLGLDERPRTRVARSWDTPNPDSTLTTARTKELLGEPWYRFDTPTSISMHPDWVADNLTDERELLDPTIRVRARCHVDVVGPLSAALADVASAGLAAEIDVTNANTYGGCFVPRFARGSGYLSRHSYGMAFDTNTVENCIGCVPRMDCDVVRIFRRHGFAWGGNFRNPDGMHFEWMGEPRDQIPYDSAYCPNIVAASSLPDRTTLGRTVLAHGLGELG